MSIPMNTLRSATEAVQATALASRIICFLASTTNLLHGPRETYQIGGLLSYQTVGDAIDELSEAHSKFNGPCIGSSRNDDLRRLARNVTELSSRLSKIIAEFERAEPEGQEATWPGLFDAGRTILRDQEAQDLSNDLQNCQDRITTLMTSVVRSKIDRLFELMSDRNVKTGYSDIQQVVKSLNQGISACSIIHQDTQTQQLVRVQQEELDRIRKFRILDILEYEKMRHRRDEIREQFAKIQEDLEPFGGIFPWAFGVDEDEVDEEEQALKYRVRDDFMDWLVSDGGIFHVRGKPGTGKSILMEYLFSHPATKRELEKRSKSKKVIRLAHIFSTLVGGDQQTLIGLRRTLLHDLLDQHPEFMSDLGLTEFELDDKSILHWGVGNAKSALNSTLDAIIEKAVKSGTCVCLFIDGLDENEDPSSPNQDDLIIQLKAWRDLGVKLCVASREEPVFDLLQPQKRMSLEHLTRSDMKRPVTQWLCQFDQVNQETSDFLVEEMSVKAGGDFQWLALAMKDANRWLSAQTEVGFARLMLDDIPPTLGGILSKTLDKIGDNQTSRTKGSSTLLMLPLLEKYNIGLDLAGYSFLDAYFRDSRFVERLQASRLGSFDRVDQNARISLARRRLISLCGDFVKASADSRCLKYTHRLTKDYLQRAEVQQRLVNFSDDCNISDLASNLILASKILTLTNGRTMPDTEVQKLLQIRIDGALDTASYWFLSIFDSLPLPIDLLKASRSETTDEGNDEDHPKDVSNTASPGINLMEKLYCSPFHILVLRGMYEYPSWKLQNDENFLSTEKEVFYLTDLLFSRAYYRKLKRPDLQFIGLFLHSRQRFFEKGIRCCAAHYKTRQGVLQLYLNKYLTRQNVSQRSNPPSLSKADQKANMGLMIELLLRSGHVKKPWFKITTINAQGNKQQMTFRAWIIKVNPPNKDRILQALPWHPVVIVLGVAMGIVVGILIHLAAVHTGQHWLYFILMLPGIWRFCRGHNLIPKVRWRMA
ncbi:hypothetical protein ACHAPT_010935 [Fusarium lateritium]